MRFATGPRISLFGLALCLTFCDQSLACQVESPKPDSFLFESYEGSFVSVKKSTLTINTLDGEKSFRLLQSKEDLVNLDLGRLTSISVTGAEHATFLKAGMTIRFEAQLDKTGMPVQPIEQLEVLALSDKFETDKEHVADVDPVAGIATYRITGRIQTIDSEFRHLAVLVHSGRKTTRIPVEVDPEKTRVDFDLPEMSLSKPGATAYVRCLPLLETRNIASEVRITCPSTFPEDAERTEPMVDNTAAAASPFEKAMKEGTERSADSADEDVTGEGNDDGPAKVAEGDTTEPPGTEPDPADDAGEVIEFDFNDSDGAIVSPNFGPLTIVLQMMREQSRADRDESEGEPITQARHPIPAPLLRGDGWFKIN